MEGVEQLVTPHQGAPERRLAWAVTPDQKPLRYDGEDCGRDSTAQIEERKAQQRVQEVEIIMQEQQRGKQQADQDDETSRGRDDAHELDGGPLGAQFSGGVESSLLGELRALLPLR